MLINEILAIIFFFVWSVLVMDATKALYAWRRLSGAMDIDLKTVIDFYYFCREVCESHNALQLGGEENVIELDETFLCRHKYHRGRKTTSMTKTIFRIYCRDDKEGLFFMVNGKSKRDLWPLVCKYCHPATSVICSDSAGQYTNIDILFTNCVHKKTNHLKGEFVNKFDRANYINSLESENKLLIHAITSLQNDNVIRKNMSVYFYKRRRLQAHLSYVEKIHHFLQDLKDVYPGPGKDGKHLMDIELPTPESEWIEQLMPPPSPESSRWDFIQGN